MGRYVPADIACSVVGNSPPLQTELTDEALGSFPTRHREQASLRIIGSVAVNADSDDVLGAFSNAFADIEWWDGAGWNTVASVEAVAPRNQSKSASLPGPFNIKVTQQQLDVIKIRARGRSDANDGSSDFNATVTDWFILTRRQQTALVLP